MNFYRLGAGPRLSNHGRVVRYFDQEQETNSFLPGIKCPSCDRGLGCPALPFGRSSLLANLGNVGRLSPTLKKFIHLLTNPNPDIPFPKVSAVEFIEIQQMVRVILGLDDSYPVISHARIVPLKVNWLASELPPFIIDGSSDPILIHDGKFDSAFDLSDLADIRRSPVENSRKRTSFSYIELSICSVGKASVSDDEVYDAWMNDEQEDRIYPEWLRCKVCGRLARRYYSIGSDRIEARSDLFVLSEFSGLYVSERGRVRLETIAPDETFEFKSVEKSKTVYLDDGEDFQL